MKSIFKLNIDVSDLKGVVSNISDLELKLGGLKNSLGGLASNLVKEVPEGINTLKKIDGSVTGLDGSVNKLNDRFRNLGMIVRGIAINSFSKLTSVLKTSLMSIGALVGAVTGVFNLANGTNRTQTEAAFTGLSYAEQKALDDANQETGFNANFSTNKAGFHQGSDTIAARALLEGGVLSRSEFDSLKNDSRSYYKLNDKLYKEYQRIKSISPNEDIADETFKQKYGSVLSQFGYGDFAQFKLANQNGVIDRHKQTFSDTYKAYSGIDVNSLMKGERALNQFSETLKAFAIGTASKFLPLLTKGLKSLTETFQKLGKYLGESSVVKELASLVGSFVEFITVVIEKALGFVSSLMGEDIKNLTVETVRAGTKLLSGATSYLKGDKETGKKNLSEAYENIKSVGSRIAVGASKIESSVSEKSKSWDAGIQSWIDDKVRKPLGLETLSGKTEEKYQKIEDMRKEIRNNHRNNYVDGGKGYETLNHQTVIPLTVNIDGRKAQMQTITLDQQINTQGKINNQSIRTSR